MSERRGNKKPRFPRKQWRPGQQERVESPKKGKGAHRRRGECRATEDEIEESLGDGERPPTGPDEDGGSPEGG